MSLNDDHNSITSSVKRDPENVTYKNIGNLDKKIPIVVVVWSDKRQLIMRLPAGSEYLSTDCWVNKIKLSDLTQSVSTNKEIIISFPTLVYLERKLSFVIVKASLDHLF